ncbi:hypothetical protein Tco_1125440 [Tanacetum coccineum]|uniref:Uncharacterized protein n=1 Tax=Tanacetum coccineum TaxID=301880 RepID=A0ABQ5JAD6_9ASTR
MLSTAVNMWTRNLVIRQRVEDLQLGIESYQKQLNLTKLGCDAKGFEYKHNYTIIDSPRAVVFPVSNNERKIMRFNEIYKFSDGTLTNILEALDYKVKEYKVNLLNPGMNTRFWTDKDVIRSKEFIHAIERRLKTRRIFRNLECFVGGRNIRVIPKYHSEDGNPARANIKQALGRNGATIRGYDTIIVKWKILISPKVVAFSVVYDSVQRMDENGSSGLVLFQNALAEFETGYEHPFTIEACWRILKNHEAWTEVEMPSFNQRPDEHEIYDRYLTEKEQQQLLLDEDTLRETSEEE